MANGGTVILPAFDRFAGLRQGLQNFAAGQAQQLQRRQAGRQLQQLFPNLNLQGITDPRIQAIAAQFALQQQSQQAGLLERLAGQNVPFTLTPGAERFTAAGQRIAGVPATPIAPVQSSFQQIADPITGQQINALVSPITGDIIRKFGTIEEGLTAKDKVQVAVTQAKEFRADPRIKNLNIIERSERGMVAALKMATAPDVKSRIASDQALGVLFQKMLDPESVVRESEFARTPEGAALMNQLLAVIPQLKLGGLKLLDEDRQALVAMARKLLQGAKITANRAFDEFETRADEIGLNKKIVFGGAKKFDISEPRPSRVGIVPITATNPQTGQKIQSFDGGKTWQPIQ
jgi:hypothetical protein